MQQSLAYYTENFGPYKHKQARIIEFPRIATFAQAFPGTMPYSESIGFIANLEKPDDIDMVFYVVAHEMAHQWWAHQVIGARMQGATVLSETLAQYSALMVMEREYGRDMMRKFLRYEMDSYLRSRGQEIVKEQPLLTVTPDQGYVHYRKGSVALYYLKELIGEVRVNAALKEIIDKHPDDIDAMMRIGRLLSIAHNSAGAKEWFARAIQRAPSAVEPRLALIDLRLLKSEAHRRRRIWPLDESAGRACRTH